MTVFIIRRLLLAIPTLVGVTIITFALLHLAPGGPALALAGEKATPAQVAAITHELGLDKPWPEQYAIWVGALLHGDLGFSYIRQQPVIALIGERLPQTMLLMGFALIVSIVFAVPLGVYQAYRRNSAFDRTASVAVFMAWSMPTFWFGTILIAVFAVTLRWL